MTQDTTPETPEVPSGLTEESAASAILEKMGVAKQPPAEDKPEDESPEPEADEAKPEPEDEPEEQSDESDDIEIDVAGEKYKLPAALKEQAKTIEAKVKEIEAGATRKFQEAADLRKVAETQVAHAEQLTQLSEQEVDLLADKRMIARRLQQIPNLYAAARANGDPVQLGELNAEFNELSIAEKRVDEALGQVKGQSKAARDKQKQSRLQFLEGFAQKNIKGWSEDYSQTLWKFSVKELGADPDTLASVMSEPVLKALDLAYRGWKVQTTDPKAKQVTSTKTLKPGATGQMKTNAQVTADKAVQRLGKTGSTDDAAAALLARMRAKRR